MVGSYASRVGSYTSLPGSYMNLIASPLGVYLCRPLARPVAGIGVKPRLCIGVFRFSFGVMGASLHRAVRVFGRADSAPAFRVAKLASFGRGLRFL